MQTDPAAGAAANYWMLVAAAVVVVLALIALWIFAKGRRRPGDHVFRASRLSRGNRLFPAQVIVSPTSITHFKPQWVGLNGQTFA